MLLIVSMITLLTASCGEDKKKKEEAPVEYEYVSYYMNERGTQITQIEHVFSAKGFEGRVSELIEALCASDTAHDRYAVIPQEVSILHRSLEEDAVYVVDFEETYNEIISTDPVREALMRAAIVHTLCRLPEIYKVQLTVGGKPIRIRDREIGPQSEADFVDDVGEALDVVDFELTFLAADKTQLKTVNRLALLDDYKPREQYALEILFAGPKEDEEDLISAVPKGTSIRRLYTKNGICYIDLSTEFLAKEKNVKAYMPIQAIASTLIRNFPYIDGIMLSVDGEPLKSYHSLAIPAPLTLSDLEGAAE